MKSDKESIRSYPKGYNKEVLLVSRVLTNKDGSIDRLNHFALRMKLLITANQVSFVELRRLKGVQD
jgi:hypothetical protein